MMARLRTPSGESATLAIRKPKIRLTAAVGDWVAATGSKHSPVGDISGELVYAMRVTDKLPMSAYDALTRAELRRKIPLATSGDPRRGAGDFIYDFSNPTGPRQRPGSLHREGEKHKDLSGQYVLLSTHYYYFGDKPVLLPPNLQTIVNQRQGHRSDANEAYAAQSVEWVEGLGYPPGAIVGNPQGWSRRALSIPPAMAAPTFAPNQGGSGR